ncbi:hypothetical protein HMPREF9575_01936 [Cutibacterium acnes HL110PA1]|nr:hypothetical protein HMPREF9575_01936 [Cutibacterium acnes HL110PA1]
MQLFRVVPSSPRGMPRRGGPAAIKSRRSLLARPSGFIADFPVELDRPDRYLVS